MKAKFFAIIIFGTWMAIITLVSGQLPAPKAKPEIAPTKASPAKNPTINGNRQNRGWGPMSVGGPAKATKGTGAVTGTAGAHKR